MRTGRRPECAIVLVAFALRAWRLGDASIWWDEGLAVWALRKPFLETTLWTAGDVHPPLFFWSLWPWMRLAGQSAYALRFNSLVWGLLTVVVGLALGRRLGGRGAGLAAGLLLAVSPLQVTWSIELRMYMLAGLCVLVALLAALTWVETDRRRWLLTYLLAALAALHTVYLCGVALAVVNLGLLWAALRRRIGWQRYGRWLATQLALTLLFLPWWRLASGRMQSWSSIRAPTAPGFVLELGASLLASGRSVDLAAGRPTSLAFWLGLGLATALALPTPRRLRLGRPARLGSATGLEPTRNAPWVAARVLGLFLVLPPLAIWAATQPRSIFYAPQLEARYFLPFAAPIYVLAGWLLALAWRRRPGLATLALLGLLLPQLAGLPEVFAQRRLRDDYPSMVLAIWTQAEPGDVVLLVSGERYPLFLYHYDRPWDAPDGSGAASGGVPAAGLGTLEPLPRPPVVPFPSRANKALGRNDWQDPLAAIVAAHPRVWLAEVERQHQDPEGRVQAWLRAHLRLQFEEGYGPDALYLFAKEDGPPRLTGIAPSMPGLERVAAPADAPLLATIGLPAREALPGDRLYLSLFENPDAVPPAPPLQASLELRGSAGWAPLWRGALPSPTGGEPRRLRLELPVSERLPAGHYRWRVEAALDTSARSSGTAPGRERPNPSGPNRSWSLVSPSLRVRGSAPRVGTRPTAVGLGFGSVELASLALPAGPFRPGSTLPVELVWRSPSGTELPWSSLPETGPVVFVHLLGPIGPEGDAPLRADADGPPGIGLGAGLGDRLFDRHLLRLPAELEAGDYQLAVGLYDPVSGERWPIDARARRDPAVAGPSLQIDPAERQLRVGSLRIRRWP